MNNNEKDTTRVILGENLKRIREKQGLSKVKVAEMLSDLIGKRIDSSAFSNWEKGLYSPTISMLPALCTVLKCQADDLLNTNKDEDNSNIVKIQKTRLPILGKIACGKPIYAEEDLECYVDCIDNIKADFALWAEGDSMIEARINNGDLVFIKKQDTVENGEIAAVLIEDEATLKRVYYDEKNATLTLMPANSKYPPFTYCKEELNSIKILGKAVAFQSLVK